MKDKNFHKDAQGLREAVDVLLVNKQTSNLI